MSLSKFNENQRKVITLTTDVNQVNKILVIAGAGSGKTTVLTHRIQYILEQKNQDGTFSHNPQEILALTFTKKAANEMKDRLCSLTPLGQKVLVGTFHSVAVKLLKRYYHQNFTIIDSSDQNNIIKRLIKELDIDSFKAKDFIERMSNIRNKGLDLLSSLAEFKDKAYKRLGEAYINKKTTLSLFDFDDLIEKTVELLSKNKQLRDTLSSRLKYLLVDEYQDTNTVQFRVINLMLGKETQLLEVGDEDQLIYSWRGAEIKYIIDSWKKTKAQQGRSVCVVLDVNYRCSDNILQFSNTIIAENKIRSDKKIRANKDKMLPVSVIDFVDDTSEAEGIAKQISLWKKQGERYGDLAVLFRINRMSKNVEKALIKANIPYKLYNGTALFDRVEVKLLLSLMMFTENDCLEHCLESILSHIKIGISFERLKQMKLKAKGSPSWLSFLLTDDTLKTKSKVQHFATTLKKYQHKKPMEMAENLLFELDLLSCFKEKERESRSENIQMMIDILRDYEQKTDPKEYSVVHFQETRLLDDAFIDGEQLDVVHLMSIHKAKGLEFARGFVVGVQDGVFPVDPDIEDEEDLRLAYVAFTRFMKELCVTKASFRVGFRYIEMHSSIMDKHKPYFVKNNIAKYIMK